MMIYQALGRWRSFGLWVLLLGLCSVSACGNPQGKPAESALDYVPIRKLHRLTLTLAEDAEGRLEAAGIPGGQVLPGGLLLIARDVEGWPEGEGLAPLAGWFESASPSEARAAPLWRLASRPGSVEGGWSLEQGVEGMAPLDKNLVRVVEGLSDHPTIDRGEWARVVPGDAFATLDDDPTRPPWSRIRAVHRVESVSDHEASLRRVAGTRLPSDGELMWWLGGGIEAGAMGGVLMVFPEDWSSARPEGWPDAATMAQQLEDDLAGWAWGDTPSVSARRLSAPIAPSPGEDAWAWGEQLREAGFGASLRSASLVMWFTVEGGVARVRFAGPAIERIDRAVDAGALEGEGWVEVTRALWLSEQRRWAEVLMMGGGREASGLPGLLRAQALEGVGARREARSLLGGLRGEGAVGMSARRLEALMLVRGGEQENALALLAEALTDARAAVLAAHVLEGVGRPAEALERLEGAGEGASSRWGAELEATRVRLTLRVKGRPLEDAALLSLGAVMSVEARARLWVTASSLDRAGRQQERAGARLREAARLFEEAGLWVEAGAVRMEALRLGGDVSGPEAIEASFAEAKRGAEALRKGGDHGASGEALLIAAELAWPLAKAGLEGWAASLGEVLEGARVDFSRARRLEGVAQTYLVAAQVFLELFEGPTSKQDAWVAMQQANLYARAAGDLEMVAHTELLVAVLLKLQAGAPSGVDPAALRERILLRLESAERFAKSAGAAGLLEQIEAVKGTWK